MGTKYEAVTGLAGSIDWQGKTQQGKPVRCVAADRPSCQITCAGGECVAFYHEPSGPCISQCLGAGVQLLKLSDEFSLQIVAKDGRAIAGLFGDQLPRMLVDMLRAYPQPVRIRGRFSREAFTQRLWETVGVQLRLDDPSEQT